MRRVLCFAFLIIMAGWMIVLGCVSRQSQVINQAYYTDDDGATYFVDKVELVAPFQHNGKEAVRAMVFKCGEGKPFVALMSKYTPEAQKAIKDFTEAPDKDKMRMSPPEMARMEGQLFKKPKDAVWYSQKDMQSVQKIMDLKCPDGAPLDFVWPGK